MALATKSTEFRYARQRRRWIDSWLSFDRHARAFTCHWRLLDPRDVVHRVPSETTGRVGVMRHWCRVVIDVVARERFT